VAKKTKAPARRAWLTTEGAAKRYKKTTGQVSRAAKAGFLGKSKRVPVVRVRQGFKYTRHEWRIDAAGARLYWGGAGANGRRPQ
jgi:hypothetical protein